MLYLEVLSKTALELLKYIQNQQVGNMRLVGGTALALQYGHRKSDDLDFFGQFPDNPYETLVNLFADFGKVITLKRSPSILVFSVDNIKIDFVDYSRYQWLENPVKQNGFILASDKDIAAMKLAAITGRGTKKDFWDLYYLLEKYSLQQIFNYYNEKYPDASVYLALKSLVYFIDAEKDKDPEPLMKLNWGSVKERIIKLHRSYIDDL